MKTSVKCFLLEHLKTSRYSLRRYSASDEVTECPGYGYHNAKSAPIAETSDGDSEYYCTNPPERPAEDDPRWPTKCDHCEYRFEKTDHWQVFGSALYKRSDTGEITTLSDAPAGAMWDATWWPSEAPDGHCWTVRLPDGADWMIDGKANNCKCPPDPNHRCWSRSGVAPALTANPSIKTSGYHGFLRKGVLESC